MHIKVLIAYAMWRAIYMHISAEPISIFNQIIYSGTTNSLNTQACTTQLILVCLGFIFILQF